MSDLIWIGNSLYPRWVLLAVPLGLLAMLALSSYMIDKTRQK